jgi:hypothetical protein
MSPAAIDALAYWTAVYWLGGFAVGCIIKMIMPSD